MNEQGEGSDRHPDRRDERRLLVLSNTLESVLLVKAGWNTVLLGLALDGRTAPTALIAAGAALGLTEVVLRACKQRRH